MPLPDRSDEPDQNGDGEDRIESAHREAGPENVDPNLIAPKHSLQQVSTKAQRVKVIKWMALIMNARGRVGHITLEACKKFPNMFRSST